MYKYIYTHHETIGNKIAKAVAKSDDNRIRNVSRNLQQNNSGTVTNEHDKEISKERYESAEERKEIIDELRLK